MTVLAFILGVVIGSVPSADWLARRRGIELRQDGSRNPGTNNALRLGGPRLAALVLVAEASKGFLAVWLGTELAAQTGAVAGIGATLGNVYNPWLRFQGGKGLAITAGTIVAAWPPVVLVLGTVMAILMAAFRRSGPAALITLGAYNAVSWAGLAVALPGRWLISDPGWMLAMAIGSSLIMAPKHVHDTLRPASPPVTRG